MIKIYEKNSYENHTATQVTASKEEKGKHLIQLKESIFFPEEGGQYADSGIIIYGNKELKLLDGQIKKGEIWYSVEEEIPEGSDVICRLDWPIRYSRMQQHSGEHILTGVIHNRYGYDNIGFHLSDDSAVTLVMNGDLTREEVLDMERVANDVIYRNLPIVDSYPSKEELEHINYRSKKEIEGQVRLITVGCGDDVVDICACCAPHVAHTGEIGLIKVVSVAAYKGGTQIGILCGKRALDYIRNEHEMIDKLARSFSTSIDKIPDSVESMREEIASLRETTFNLIDEKMKRIISELKEGKNACLFIDEDASPAIMKNCYNAMCEKYEGKVAVFAGKDGKGYRYYAGSRSEDSRLTGNILKEKLGAKGGGNEEMVQGRVDAAKSDIEKLFE